MTTDSQKTGLMIQVFDFNSQAVRTVMRDGEAWFVAADVCRVLEIANSRDALKSLEADERACVGITDTSSSSRNSISVNVINESGLYALIFKSRKAEARKFRRWVTGEVLPALRRTGRFEAAPAEGVVAGGAALLSILEFLSLKLATMPVGMVFWADVLELGRAVQVAERDLGLRGAVRMEPDGSKARTFSPVLLETVWGVHVMPRLTNRSSQGRLEAAMPA